MNKEEIVKQIRQALDEFDDLQNRKYKAFSTSKPSDNPESLEIARIHRVFLRNVERFIHQLAVEDRGPLLVTLVKQITGPLEQLRRQVELQVEALESHDDKTAKETFDSEQVLNATLEKEARVYLREATNPRRNELIKRVLQSRRLGLASLLVLLQACVVPIAERTKEPNVFPVERVENEKNTALGWYSYEYFVPENVIVAALRFRGSDQDVTNLYAMYIPKKFIRRPRSSENIAEVRAILRVLGYAEDEIEVYLDLFFMNAIILYKTNSWGPDKYNAMVHERIHREWDMISPDANYTLVWAAVKLLRRVHEEPKKFCSDGHYPKIFCTAGADTNSQNILEFYSYLADGSLKPELLTELKSAYPEAYSIYETMLHRATHFQGDEHRQF